MKFIALLTLLSLIACASRPSKSLPEVTQPHAVDLNKEFLSPQLDVNKWKQNFAGSDRDVAIYHQDIILALDLKKDERVADVGAGTGLFLSGLSQAVGVKGKVYGVDISPRFVDEMKRMVQQEKLKNVEVVLGTSESTQLKDNSVDTVLLVDTYHHFDEPVKMLQDFRRILAPKGKLAVVDFNRTPKSRMWIKQHVRLTKAEYIKEIELNGFIFDEELVTPLRENFMLIFTKK
jgi:ubiquinone/menaquinone biosynthesis C-methylase UbiE